MMSVDQIPGQKPSNLSPDGTGTTDTVSVMEGRIGLIRHDFINGELSFEEASARINSILEQNSSDDPKAAI